MITLTKNNIHFTPRQGDKRKNGLSKILIYGVICPICNNVVEACFYTESYIPVDLWDYEETAILHTRDGKEKGLFNYYFPTVESEKGDSCYESTLTKKPNGESYQTLRMKNHIILPDRIGKNSIDRYQTGERPCTFIGATSFRKDMAIKVCLGMLEHTVNLAELNTWNWKEKTNSILTDLLAVGLKEGKTYGQIPIYSVLCSKDKVSYGINLVNKPNYL